MESRVSLVELFSGKITGTKWSLRQRIRKIPLTLESPPNAPQPQFPKKEGNDNVTLQVIFVRAGQHGKADTCDIKKC